MRNPTTRRALLMIVLATAASSCDNALGNDSPADAPLVRVLASTIVAATDVDIRLTNSSAASWGFNPCSSPRLQRRENDVWVDQPDPLILCTADILMLRAGQVRTMSYGAPIGLAAGTYRLRYRFIRADGVEVLPLSNEFVVL